MTEPVSQPTGGSSTEPRATIGQMQVKAYGKYFLVKKLAEGGMAEIFLAKQVGVEGFERNVVIKRMLPHLSGVADFVSMFLDEARLAASLNHANIVQITDLGFADGCYFICMEYLAGEDFSTVLRTARRRGEHTPLKVALRILVEAAVGLHHAHEALDAKGDPLNLVHRDVSPSNIFVTYTGQVKVLDFGIAKAESRVTSTTAGVVKGKYQYMSPEQAGGEAVDRRSDVFSLGVSLYEALTGVRPFARDSDLAVLKAVLSGEYQPIRELRPDLPLEIEQVVVRAMAPDPTHRYQTALAFAQDIERFIGASTSASGGQELVAFMASFFGSERMRSKTRVETLADLARSGFNVPVSQTNLSPVTSGGTQATATGEKAERTNAVGAPLTVRAERRKRRRLYFMAAGAGVLVLGGGALAVFRSRDTPLTVTPPPAPVAMVDAGASVVPPPLRVDDSFDAGPSEPLADSGVEPTVVDAGSRVGPPVAQKGPVVLTTPMVTRAISANKKRFQKCFVDNAGELPASGELKVTFSVASSGRVSSVSTQLPGTKLSTCVEKVVRDIPFPRHVDNEVTLTVPLRFGTTGGN